MTPMNGCPIAMENLLSFELQSTGSVTGTCWPSSTIFAGGVAGGGGADAAGESGLALALVEGAELDDGAALLPLEHAATLATAVTAATAIKSSRFNGHLP